jgi:hypothetical protein
VNLQQSSVCMHRVYVVKCVPDRYACRLRMIWFDVAEGVSAACIGLPAAQVTGTS